MELLPAARVEGENSSDFFGSICKLLRSLFQRTYVWYCVSCDALMWRAVVDEFRVLWYPVVDVGILLTTSVLVGVGTGLQNAEVCRSASVVVTVLCVIQFFISVYVRPFTSRFSQVCVTTGLVLATLSCALQTAFMFSNVNNGTGSPATSTLVASSVFDLMLSGLTLLRIVVVDGRETVLAFCLFVLELARGKRETLPVVDEPHVNACTVEFDTVEAIDSSDSQLIFLQACDLDSELSKQASATELRADQMFGDDLTTKFGVFLGQTELIESHCTSESCGPLSDLLQFYNSELSVLKR